METTTTTTNQQFNKAIDKLAETITTLCVYEGIINTLDDDVFENRMYKIAEFSADFLVDKTANEMGLYNLVYYLCFGKSFAVISRFYTHYLQELKMQKYMIKVIEKITNNN
jgi:hypothetical protein